MSQAAVLDHTLQVEPVESPLTPESWGKLGMWLFLAGDAMSFGGLIAGYAALRLGDPNWPVPSSILGVPFTAVMTFLLICSSVTMVKGLEAIKRGDQAGLRRFLALTALGGAWLAPIRADGARTLWLVLGTALVVGAYLWFFSIQPDLFGNPVSLKCVHLFSFL